WQTAPRYEAPAYVASHHQPRGQIPVLPDVVLAALVVAGILIVVILIAASDTQSAGGDVEAIHRSIDAMRAQAREHDATINAIQEHVGAAEIHAFVQGQQDADWEWRRLTGE